MTHEHTHPLSPTYRVFILAGTALALIAIALFSQQPAKAPTPHDAPNLSAAFDALALPQPETGCTVNLYNAKGGELAKPELTCTVRGKQVTRSLPNPTEGKMAVMYQPVARPDEDTVVLKFGRGEGELPDAEWYTYSFRTWKLTPLKEVNAVTDAFGWGFATISPDATHMAWIPHNPEQGGSTVLQIITLPTGTLQKTITAATGEVFGIGSDLNLEQHIGWKDSNTVLYGIYKEGVLSELREVTVD